MSRAAVLSAPDVRVAAVPSLGAEPEVERESLDGSRRLGILGGTFDPPHIGHLWLATLALDALALDRVLFMPVAQPPHKAERTLSSATDRLLMTRLAIGENPSFEVSGVEMERPGASYTIDSIEELQRSYGEQTTFFLVMAADSLAQIDTWKEPDRLLSMLEWAVGPRPGTALPDRRALEVRFGGAADRIHLLDGPSLDVSSSVIRQRVASGLAIRYLVPAAVEDLILSRRLYRP